MGAGASAKPKAAVAEGEQEQSPRQAKPATPADKDGKAGTVGGAAAVGGGKTKKATSTKTTSTGGGGVATGAAPGTTAGRKKPKTMRSKDRPRVRKPLAAWDFRDELDTERYRAEVGVLIWNEGQDREYRRIVVAENSIWAVPQKERNKATGCVRVPFDEILVLEHGVGDPVFSDAKLQSKTLYATIAHSPRVDPVSGLVRPQYNDEKLKQVQVVTWEHAGMMYKHLRRAWINVLLRQALGIPIACAMTTGLVAGGDRAGAGRPGDGGGGVAAERGRARRGSSKAGLAPHVGGDAAKAAAARAGRRVGLAQIQELYRGIERDILKRTAQNMVARTRALRELSSAVVHDQRLKRCFFQSPTMMGFLVAQLKHLAAPHEERHPLAVLKYAAALLQLLYFAVFNSEAVPEAGKIVHDSVDFKVDDVVTVLTADYGLDPRLKERQVVERQAKLLNASLRAGSPTFGSDIGGAGGGAGVGNNSSAVAAQRRRSSVLTARDPFEMSMRPDFSSTYVAAGPDDGDDDDDTNAAAAADGVGAVGLADGEDHDPGALLPLDVLFSPKRNPRIGRFDPPRHGGSAGSLASSLSSSVNISLSLLRWRKQSSSKGLLDQLTPEQQAEVEVAAAATSAATTSAAASAAAAAADNPAARAAAAVRRAKEEQRSAAERAAAKERRQAVKWDKTLLSIRHFQVRLLVELSEKTQHAALAQRKLAPSFVRRLGWGDGDGARKSERRRLAEQALVDQLARFLSDFAKLIADYLGEERAMEEQWEVEETAKAQRRKMRRLKRKIRHKVRQRQERAERRAAGDADVSSTPSESSSVSEEEEEARLLQEGGTPEELEAYKRMSAAEKRQARKEHRRRLRRKQARDKERATHRRAKERERLRKERARQRHRTSRKQAKLRKKQRRGANGGAASDVDDRDDDDRHDDDDDDVKSTEPSESDSSSDTTSSDSDALDGVHKRHRVDGVDPGVVRRQSVRSARVYYYCHLFRNLAHSVESLWERALDQSADTLSFLLCKTSWFKMFKVASVLDRQSMLWLTEMKIEQSMPGFETVRGKILWGLDFDVFLKYVQPPQKKPEVKKARPKLALKLFLSPRKQPTLAVGGGGGGGPAASPGPRAGSRSGTTSDAQAGRKAGLDDSRSSSSSAAVSGTDSGEGDAGGSRRSRRRRGGKKHKHARARDRHGSSNSRGSGRGDKKAKKKHRKRGKSDRRHRRHRSGSAGDGPSDTVSSDDGDDRGAGGRGSSEESNGGRGGDAASREERQRRKKDFKKRAKSRRRKKHGTRRGRHSDGGGGGGGGGA